MPDFRVTLVERLFEADAGDFRITATDAEAAARIVLNAVPDSVDSDGIRTTILPDGQEVDLEVEEVVHGEIVAMVHDAATGVLQGQFGFSLVFSPGREAAAVLARVMDRVLADDGERDTHAACMVLRRYLHEYLNADA